MSAVSKKLMPASKACLIKGRLASSSSTHGRHLLEPYVIVPRQMRDTLRPERPRFTNCIAPIPLAAKGPDPPGLLTAVIIGSRRRYGLRLWGGTFIAHRSQFDRTRGLAL